MGKRFGILIAEVSRIEKATGREYDKTEIKIEVVELKQFNTGHSKIKIKNVIGTLDFRQMKCIEKTIPRVINSNSIKWFK